MYVLDKVCMLSSDSSYLMLGQFCSYQFSQLKCDATNEMVLVFVLSFLASFLDCNYK